MRNNKGFTILELVVVIAVVGILSSIVLATINVAHIKGSVTVGAVLVNPALPNAVMTPGATNPDVTQATISQNICNLNWSTKSIRPPVSYTTPLKIKQIALYKYADTSTASYEEDHLISLELGGSPTDPKNLWPEPYAGKYGAHQKDLVENYLHKEVCSGAMTLGAAQTAISSDWTKVYDQIVPPGSLGSTEGTVDDDDN